MPSTAVLSPYPEGPAKVTVSLVTIDAQGVAKITLEPGQEHHGARDRLGRDHSGRRSRSPTPSLVWGEVSYDYTPRSAMS